MFEFISKKLNNYLINIPKIILTIAFITATLILGYIEYLTKCSTCFILITIFFIMYSSWYINKATSIILSVLTSVLIVLNSTGSINNSELIYFIISNSFRFLFLMVFSFLISEIKNKFDKIKKLAKTDYLTGILNSRAFFESAKVELKRCERYKQPMTVLYIDIDNFKKINDTFGHHKGDSVLHNVANVLKDNIRLTDIVARLGGDEFAVMLPYTGYEASQTVITKINKKLLYKMPKNKGQITYSIGAVTYTDFFPKTIDEMIKEVDEVMYSVKKTSKNSVKHVNIAIKELAFTEQA